MLCWKHQQYSFKSKSRTNLRHGHGVDQPLDVLQLDKVPARVEDDASVRELWPIDDGDVVEDDVGAGHVVILDQLEEGLQAVPQTEVVYGRHVGGEQGPWGSLFMTPECLQFYYGYFDSFGPKKGSSNKNLCFTHFAESVTQTS